MMSIHIIDMQVVLNISMQLFIEKNVPMYFCSTNFCFCYV